MKPWLLLASLLAGCASREPDPALRVMAAASLTDALPRVGEAWRDRTGQEVRFTFDGSSRLARQLDAGAEADLLVTADVAWMDWAAERSLVHTDTRRDVLGNELVVVVPRASSFVPEAAADLAGARVALAGESVPAGRYARAALEHAGAWDAIAPGVVRGDDVRAALAWVAAGEADAGVVYATDARVEPGVIVAFAFPSEAHPPIVYPAAVTAGAHRPDDAAAFLAFAAEEAGAHLEAAGFHPLRSTARETGHAGGEASARRPALEPVRGTSAPASGAHP